MAYEISPYVMAFTGVAGADLSAAANQYKLVKLDSNGNIVLCSAATDNPVGVLQNTPASGQEAQVTVIGITKLRVSNAITTANLQTTLLGTDTAGLGTTYALGTDVTKPIVARPLTAAGGTGELVTAIVDCAANSRAVTGN